MASGTILANFFWRTVISKPPTIPFGIAVYELDHCREPKVFSTSHTLSPAHPTFIYAIEIQVPRLKAAYIFLSVSYDGHYHQFLTQLSELVIFLLASQNMNTTPCETLWVESLLLTTYLFTISLNYFQLLRLIRKGQPELRLRLQAKPNAVSLKACENGIVLHYV